MAIGGTYELRNTARWWVLLKDRLLMAWLALKGQQVMVISLEWPEGKGIGDPNLRLLSNLVNVDMCDALYTIEQDFRIKLAQASERLGN